MNCTRCGHPYRNHELGVELRCRMRIAYDWNEKTKGFDKTAPCRCPGYLGRLPNQPVGKAGCPHEYVRWQPECVHCGHVRVAPKEEAT